MNWDLLIEIEDKYVTEYCTKMQKSYEDLTIIEKNKILSKTLDEYCGIENKTINEFLRILNKASNSELDN